MKIGIALSGGGARGIAHLGVLKALEELKLKPNYISGTSAGSIVGALYSAGYSPDFILETILSHGIKNHIKFALNRFGLFSLEKLESLFLEYIPHNTFEALKLPLTVCAVDIVNGEIVYFDKGELIKPIMASCSIPGIFAPVKFNNLTLIDGGVLNNLPIEPLNATCDFIIGVNVTPIDKKYPISSAKDIIMKCLYLAISQQAESKSNKFDIVINPDHISKFDAMNLKKAKTLFDIGYESTLKQMEGKMAQIL